jgi:hypothetical protein
MHNPVQPETKLTIAGAEYTLVFDFEAIAEAERLTKRPLLAGLQPEDVQTPTIDMVRAMLFACIHSRHPKLTIEEVNAFVTRKSFSRIWVKVLKAWTEDWADLAENAPADPLKSQS